MISVIDFDHFISYVIYVDFFWRLSYHFICDTFSCALLPQVICGFFHAPAWHTSRFLQLHTTILFFLLLYQFLHWIYSQQIYLKIKLHYFVQLSVSSYTIYFPLIEIYYWDIIPYKLTIFIWESQAYFSFHH